MPPLPPPGLSAGSHLSLQSSAGIQTHCHGADNSSAVALAQADQNDDHTVSSDQFTSSFHDGGACRATTLLQNVFALSWMCHEA